MNKFLYVMRCIVAPAIIALLLAGIVFLMVVDTVDRLSRHEAEWQDRHVPQGPPEPPVTRTGE